MLRKIPRAMLPALLFVLCVLGAAGAADASDRHGDLPLATTWRVYGLDDAARAATGLSARRVGVLTITPDTGWHTYSNTPGGFAKPTTLALRQKGAVLPTLYPAGAPSDDPMSPGAKVGLYPAGTPLFTPLPGDASGRLTGVLDLLLCASDKCLPARLDLDLPVPTGKLAPASAQPWWPKLVRAARDAAGTSTARKAAGPTMSADNNRTAPPVAALADASAVTNAPGAWSNLRPRYHQPELEVRGLFKAVLFGLIAGFILNFMPCVLPVISIKLSALMAGGTLADAAQRRTKFRQHNFYFALGILIYFFLLGMVLGATGLAWGQLFQRPAVVLGLTALIFALSLSLFGVFSLPIVDLRFDQMAAHPKLQALFTGLLATLLATPCSGPFLGGVLGWTLLQPPWVICAVMFAVGGGMALPYLLMALFPGVARLLPKPGPWSGHLEKIVGLLLMATCVYLLSIIPETRLIGALLALWLVAVSCWLWGAAGPGLDAPRRVIPKLLAAGFLILAAFLAARPAAPPTRLDAYSDARLRDMLGRQTVVVDFTADWCPSCKALEQTTLTPGRLGAMKKKYGLSYLKADLTEADPEAEALLAALGSQSIPLLAIFPKDDPDKPLVLRDLFTPTQFENAVKQTTRPE